MANQFITNESGEKTSVIIPIGEYEDLVHSHHINLELTDEYKLMIDNMLAQEEKGTMKYVSLAHIKSRFQR